MNVWNYKFNFQSGRLIWKNKKGKETQIRFKNLLFKILLMLRTIIIIIIIIIVIITSGYYARVKFPKKNARWLIKGGNFIEMINRVLINPKKNFVSVCVCVCVRYATTHAFFVNYYYYNYNYNYLFFIVFVSAVIYYYYYY